VLANVRVLEIETALAMRDFPRLAAAVIADSNQCAACALDTTPPQMYLESLSQKLMAMAWRLLRTSTRPTLNYFLLLCPSV